MQYRKLGRSELSVSVVCLGSWSIATKDFFWDNQQRADSLATVHAALEAGVNFFDTAPAYGEGEAEEILGEALAGRRRQVVVATKVRPADLEPARLRASCETSLRALRTDYVDLLQIHWPNPAIPLEPTYRAMEDLCRAGKVRYLGVSNFGASYLDELAGREKGGSPPFPVVSNQVPYSLLWRAIEYDIEPRCVEREISILCYSPLHQALLSGKFLTADDVPEKRARSRLFSSRRAMTRHGEPGCEAEAFAALSKNPPGGRGNRSADGSAGDRLAVGAGRSHGRDRGRPQRGAGRRKRRGRRAGAGQGGSGVVVGDHGAAQATGGAERRPVGARLANGAAGGSVSWIVLIGCMGPVGYMNYVCRSQ